MTESFMILFLAGAIGALVKDIVQDNSLQMPKKSNGSFFLGFLGGMITGGAAGALIDGNPMTAFLAGYSGTSMIENLLTKKLEIVNQKKEEITEIITRIAKEEGVDPALAIRVAKCESLLDPNARGKNADGSIDRGLFQINNKYHPTITDDDAFDPEKSARFFCKAVKSGNIGWWNTSKKCWNA